MIGPNTKNTMRMLVAAAGLDEQHKCCVCGALLEAFSRGNNAYEQWVCPTHRDSPMQQGKTRSICANFAEQGS